MPRAPLPRPTLRTEHGQHQGDADQQVGEQQCGGIELEHAFGIEGVSERWRDGGCSQGGGVSVGVILRQVGPARAGID
jgi:hypothetical protein